MTFEQKWAIKNFENVIQNESLLENAHTQIICQAENLEVAKFQVGLQINTVEGRGSHVRVYWKLLSKPNFLYEIDATLEVELFYGNGRRLFDLESRGKAILGRPIVVGGNIFKFPCTWTEDDKKIWTNSEGSLVFNLKLALNDLPGIITLSKDKEMCLFRKTCMEKCSQDLALVAVSDDISTPDITIYAKGLIEIPANTAIMRARCPEFASMFGLRLKPNPSHYSTSLNLTDVSAKTWEIILNFWKTGIILPSWRDQDTIVELTNAARKYQMAELLKILDDDILGRELQSEEKELELLKIVHKLSLKNAEGKLLKRIVQKISQADDAPEILEWFSLDEDSCNDEDLTDREIQEKLQEVMSEQDDEDVSFRHVKLMGCACILGKKDVEDVLLKRIVGTVSKYGSANELFGLFGIEI